MAKQTAEKIQEYTKTTVGFVCQKFSRQADGKFACTEQEFIAGDQVDRENDEGENIEHLLDSTDEYYQPFDMVQPTDEFVKNPANVLKTLLDWYKEAPIDEMNAVEDAIQRRFPYSDVVYAIAHAEIKDFSTVEKESEERIAKNLEESEDKNG